MDLHHRRVVLVDRAGEETDSMTENARVGGYDGARAAAQGEPTGGGSERGRAVIVAAALSLVPTLIHLWTVPGYAWIWWGYGVFFLAVALAQGLLGVALLRWPLAPFALAGIFGNLAVVLVYVYTRTSGVPYGPHAGKVEDAGLVDMTATAAEVGLIVVLVTLLDGAYRKAAINGLLVAGVAVWALRFLGILS